MRPSSIVCATVAMILIKTNLLICIPTDLDDLPKIPSETAPSNNPEMIVNDLRIDPLPWKPFTEQVSNLLSPDIFSQADPLTYLSSKLKKIPQDSWKKIDHNVFELVWLEKFPEPYTPYAKVMSSLLILLCQLHHEKKFIQIIQRASKSSNPFEPLDLSIMEPELSPLFTSYIFTDNDPPLRLFDKLLAIPENEISNTTIRLENLLKNRLFPRRYFGYAKRLLELFRQDFIFRNLKNNIAKIQPEVLIKSLNEDYQNHENNVRENDEFETKLSNKLDSTLNSQPLQQIKEDSSTNDRKVVDLPRQKHLHNDVVKFVSPDMFSQTDLVTYFLNKVTKLNPGDIRNVAYFMSRYLDEDEFPPHYIPYAHLASSLLSSLVELNDVNNDIRDIRWKTATNYYSPLIFDMSAVDPKLSTLFSSMIISKASNPSIMILKALIDLPENEVLNIVTRLKNIQKNKRFPSIYRSYNTHLQTFLDQKHYLILRLKDDIAEMQRIVILNPATSTG